MIAWIVISIVVALAGPFGTFASQSIGWRLMYWTLIIGVSIPIAIAARVFWTEIGKSYSLWVRDILVALTMTVTFGPLLTGFNYWIVGVVDHPSVDWRLTVVATFFISLAAIAVGNVIRASVERTKTKPETEQRDRLFDRIDAVDGARLVKVSSDNHHVRILTDDWVEHRILMRLRDAVAEIDVEKGICVHRSHWVALHMIDGIEVVDGKEVVRLGSDCIVPIGPKYRHQLVDAGAIAA